MKGQGSEFLTCVCLCVCVCVCVCVYVVLSYLGKKHLVISVENRGCNFAEVKKSIGNLEQV